MSDAPDPKPTPEGAVLRFFRFAQGWSVNAFAAQAGVTPHTVGRWEKGDLALSRERLVELLALLDVAPEAIDAALLAWNLGVAPEPPREPFPLAPPERRLLGQAAAAAGLAGAAAVRRELSHERLRRRAAHHRAWAEEVWPQIKKLPARPQDIVVQMLQGTERTWALAVRMCEGSAAAAAHNIEQALHLARLAVRLAEGVPGPEAWRLRLLGYCEPFVGNALRVQGHLAAAEEIFLKADTLWQQGEEADPVGLLDGARRLDLKASLFRIQGRFAEAQALLDQALAASPPEAAARLLIKKATTHTRAGEYELALVVLQEAEPRIDGERNPRLIYGCHFMRALNYCNLDRYDEAEPLVPLIQALAEQLHNDLDIARSLWLKGRVCSGLGRREEAVAILEQVRKNLQIKVLPYDFALVSLELAVLYLEQERTSLVREIAHGMLWIFQGEHVHQEALAALALFHKAAGAEAAQTDWTRRLVKFLYRAQYNPRLHFES